MGIGKVGKAGIFGRGRQIIHAGGALLAPLLHRAARGRRERIELDRRALAAAHAEQALAGAELGLWDWHLPSDSRYADVRALAMLGLIGGERLDGPGAWRQLVHPDDWLGLNAALVEHLRQAGQPYEVEYRMRHRNGHWVWLHSRGKLVQRDAGGAPLRLAGTCIDISARKHAAARHAHLALYDGLTGLPNRGLLLDRLQHALSRCERSSHYGALLLVSLEHCQAAHGGHDGQGGAAGGRLLELAAVCLRRATRECDTVARLGGDEFVIVLEALGLTAAEALANAHKVAGKVLASLEQFHQAGAGIDVVRGAPSIGVAPLGTGQHDIDDLLGQARSAMYGAAAAGHDVYPLVDAGAQAALDASAALHAGLRFALARQELRLHYQPLVDAEARLCGVEALLRWQHPSRGLLEPAEFIAQAEESGLIVEIGAWVLETVCAQLAQWGAAPDTATLGVAINVSARQFLQPDFGARVLAALARSGARPGGLKLELTESLLLSEIDDVVAKLTLLKAHGVGCALDDFGIGYSSLRHLKLLPIDQLKIDQSFVRDMLHTPCAEGIVRAVVGLAQDLGLEVVAEGVETRAQRAALLQLGCRRFQGHLYAPALPLADLAPMLASRFRFAGAAADAAPGGVQDAAAAPA